MFAASVEAALLELGEAAIEARLEGCVRRMLGWYIGDGVYGDGEFFHFDYYNSFVIQPMLVDVLAVLRRRDPPVRCRPTTSFCARARRYAEVQERLIAPDGTFPSLGPFAHLSLRRVPDAGAVACCVELPETVKPAQVRPALTAVISRMIGGPGHLRSARLATPGFCGYQPPLAEGYISTGSLYLCSAGLLPLGLPPSIRSGAIRRRRGRRSGSGPANPSRGTMPSTTPRPWMFRR